MLDLQNVAWIPLGSPVSLSRGSQGSCWDSNLRGYRINKMFNQGFRTAAKTPEPQSPHTTNTFEASPSPKPHQHEALCFLPPGHFIAEHYVMDGQAAAWHVKSPLPTPNLVALF